MTHTSRTRGEAMAPSSRRERKKASEIRKKCQSILSFDSSATHAWYRAIHRQWIDHWKFAYLTAPSVMASVAVDTKIPINGSHFLCFALSLLSSPLCLSFFPLTFSLFLAAPRTLAALFSLSRCLVVTIFFPSLHLCTCFLIFSPFFPLTFAALFAESTLLSLRSLDKSHLQHQQSKSISTSGLTFGVNQCSENSFPEAGHNEKMRERGRERRRKSTRQVKIK